MPDVAILLYEDCQPSAVSTVIEALTIANLHWSLSQETAAVPFTWRTISIDGRPIRSKGGVDTGERWASGESG
jgi:transcriptional regulator GlxA family with amidase domain